MFSILCVLLLGSQFHAFILKVASPVLAKRISPGLIPLTVHPYSRMNFASFVCLVGPFLLVRVLARELRIPQQSNASPSIQRRTVEIVEPGKERPPRLPLNWSPSTFQLANEGRSGRWNYYRPLLSSKSLAGKSSSNFDFTVREHTPLELDPKHQRLGAGTRASRLLQGGVKNTFNTVKVPLNFVGGGAKNTMNAAKVPFKYLGGGAKNTVNAVKSLRGPGKPGE